MENINITEFIINHINKLGTILSSNGQKLVTYFLNDNLSKVFGDYILQSDNMDLMTTSKDKTTRLDIESIYTNHISIEISCDSENKVIIRILDGEEVLSTLVMTNEYVKSATSFDSDVTRVYEYKEVEMEHGDARRFFLSRNEDGVNVYEGELKPVLASNGSNEYFDFSYKGQSEENEEKSILKRIVDTVRDNSLVSINTSKELHSLSTYVDSIYKSLEERLEAKRVKKDVKVRKRVFPKTNA